MNTDPNRRTPAPHVIHADLLETVFAKRNRAYGAYPLRKAQPSILLRAFSISVTLLLLLLFSPRIAALLNGTEVIDITPPKFNPKDKEVIFTVYPPRAEAEPDAPRPAGPRAPTEAYRNVRPAPDRSVPDNTPPPPATPPLDSDLDPGLETTEGDPNGVPGGTEHGTGDAGLPANGEGSGESGEFNSEGEWVLLPSHVGKPLNMEAFAKHVRFPEAAVEVGVRGRVVLRLLVDENGRVAKHQVLSASHPLLTTAVEAELHRLRFAPAIHNGKAVRFWVVLPVNFKLAR